MHTTYSGNLVRLRPFASGEEEFLAVCEVFVRTSPHWGQLWWPRPGELKDFADTGFFCDKYCVFAIDRIDTGDLIGFEIAELGKQGPCACEVGTFIIERHQRHGFGVEAKLLNLCFLFENLNLTQAWAVTLETHERARRGIELCGMQYRGVKRRAHFSRGVWRDEVIYSMTRREWLDHPVREYVNRG